MAKTSEKSVAMQAAQAVDKVLKMRGQTLDVQAAAGAKHRAKIENFIDSLPPEVRAAFEALGGGK